MFSFSNLKRSCLFVLFICAVFSLEAQVVNHKPGEFLIKTDHPIERVIKAHQTFEGKATGLRSVKKLAPNFNIYKVSFDFGNIHEEHFLREIRNNRMVEVVQYNHIVANRAIPNDPEFPDQWQYINTGQSGGTAGADIDMDLAWDIATGGLTALGDTIVAAIIDDGIDASHSDFEDNRWYNYDEIPGNGIDDDNNGYIDDYQGWNAYNDTDDVSGGFAGWHGTPVAGIVGAKGNNGIGVSGVNQNVKLMIIQGGGDEADALAAYAYCYAERQLYNQTDGAQGSFVVTTNASWGVDFGQPADAPLWCGFYDTMGQEGIMSCGATINNNTNVDVQGDLPTACPSDFLISVTNMNDNDQKVNGAGYGAVTIDLGAFGEDTWTVALGDSYGGFGGTSGATPHVAGTVALMYSVQCPSFAAFAKADPAAAAMLIKQRILGGVDANTSLDGITVTGGRLNVNNSMQAMVDNCDPNGCFTPYGIGIDNLTDVSVNLNYSVGDQTDQIDIRYREVGGAWMDIPNAGAAPYTITGLTACTDYEFQVNATCGTETTDWSNAFPFTTDGCCEAPSSLEIAVTSENSVSLTWDAVLAATGYIVDYRPMGDPNWTSLAETNTVLEISGLLSCTVYEVRIGTECAGAQTEFTEIYTFTTLGCGICVEGNYCASSGADASFEWIESVVVNNISNTSGNDDGYGDYTNMSTDLEQGFTYTIDLEPGFDGFPYDEYFQVWIDYNQDGDFDDADELVFDAGAVTQEAISGNFQIPTGIMEGPTRMRVSMSYNGPAEACADGFDYGEVEDYCVNILGGGTPVCNIPTSITVVATTDNTAELSWDAMQNALGYEVDYRTALPGSTWLSDAVSTNSAILSGLDHCSEYEFRIRTICSVGISDDSDVDNFITECSNSAFNPQNDIQFSIAPNPVNDRIFISLSDVLDNGTAQLISVDGRLISSFRLQGNSLEIPVADLPQGSYFVRITDGKKTGIEKILKF